MREPIAIVGMACVYPDAGSPMELWENVLAQRRAFRKIPAERLRVEDYFSRDPEEVDCTYATQAAVIEGYEFDRVAFRVVGSTFRAADLAHWLALDVASRALVDAGCPGGAGLRRELTGVLVGNTLTGEFSRANLLRLRWPYVRRVVDATLKKEEWDDERRFRFLGELESLYKLPFPPAGDETLAGGLSNTIAGRICNQFDFRGGGYTVDGACAASLLAVANACAALAMGDLDVALAGGVDLSLDPFELVGFAKVGALAKERMRIYDRASAGFWPGEGCGFVLLMRYEDALAEGRRIYALIRGWGISSDGAGGITRPEPDGQILALRRAYARAGFGIETVSYFEGHGTGTKVGDASELRSLTVARRESRANVPPAMIGSIKANIGHTKAAAGLAGLIKGTMAVHSQIIPPTTGCEDPHEEISSSDSVLRVAREGMLWPAPSPVRAGVSAMGFGGINAHIVLEGTQSERRFQLTAREESLLSSAQDAEVFLLGASKPSEMKGEIQRLLKRAELLSLAELGDLAAALAERLTRHPTRAAIVAATPEELAKRLGTLENWLNCGETEKLDFECGVFLSCCARAARIGFLFPGQGSPVYFDGGWLVRRFGFVRGLYAEAAWRKAGDAVATQVAQPGVVTASLAGVRALERLGIAAAVAVGHSLGELTALHWAGALDEGALLRIAAARGSAMADLGSPTGAMASLAASEAEVSRLVAGEDAVIACYNSPGQTVISGEASAIERIADRANATGLRAVRLPVSHAFHTRLVAAAVPRLEGALRLERIGPLQRAIASTVTGEILNPEEDLRALLCRQVTSPVRFTAALRAAMELDQADETTRGIEARRGLDLWIEVGPGRVLTGLAAGMQEAPVIALDAAGPSLKGVLEAAGAAYVLGAAVRPRELFANRFARRFDLDRPPQFFSNPCEQAPTPDGREARSEFNEKSGRKRAEGNRNGLFSEKGHGGPRDDLADREPKNPQEPLTLIRELLAKRAELPLELIGEESRLLGDLHLNSISVGQVISEVSRQLGIPTPRGLVEFANATVGQAARALAELVQTGGSQIQHSAREVGGVDSWIRTFQIELVERALKRSVLVERQADWRVIALEEHPLKAPLSSAFARMERGAGVIVCLPSELDERAIRLLLEGAHDVLREPNRRRFVLVQGGWSAAGFARTLHLETGAVVSVVQAPFQHQRATEWVMEEAGCAENFSEAHYDENGTRREPRLRLLPMDEGRGEIPIDAGDVLLVTGGGKGIAAECALALGRKTGVKLVLLGRSDPAADQELAANLRRIEGAGSRVMYVRADVTEREEVEMAVRRAEAALGPVTAILHGAGTNTPHLIASLDEALFLQTIRPKVEGFRNVLRSVDQEKLKLLIAFGSIIARTGLPGEADYAVANEWLTMLTERFQADHPRCRCISLEWSVWSGLGMGQRLGRIETLIQEGITPIPPDEGVQRLCELAARSLSPVGVVVSGRFGRPPTLELDEKDLPLRRFLELKRVHYPGVELIVEVELGPGTDPYLDDHRFEGQRLFPAVLGLEAMAQVAMALMETSGQPAFEGVRFERAVTAPESGSSIIRIAGLRRPGGRVEVVLRSSETGFQIDHFRAVCVFGEAGLCPDGIVGMVDEKLPSPETKFEGLPLDPLEDLYGPLLFHTGRFRRLRGYRRLLATNCVAEISADGQTSWFGRYLPAELVLGDPGARDAALHAIQACIPHSRILPTGFDRLVTRGVSASSAHWVWARERLRNGADFIFDAAITDAAGELVEWWEGLHLRAVSGLAPRAIWIPALLGPYVERKFHELVPESTLRVVVERHDQRAGVASDRAVQCVAGTNGSIWRRPDGKPEVANGRGVSVAHAGDLLLAVSGGNQVGCDMELVRERSWEAWRALLGEERMELAEVIVREAEEELSVAATRIWAAGESLKKAGADFDGMMILISAKPGGWVLLGTGSMTVVATVRTAAKGLAEGVVIALLERKLDASV